jgi:hypothetical protein
VVRSGPRTASGTRMRILPCLSSTAAECLFEPANGGLFALHGAIGLGQVRTVAAYELHLPWVT